MSHIRPELVVLSLAALVVWHWQPSLVTCFLFWILAIAAQVGFLFANHHVEDVFSIVGASLNAIVTIANDGHMPVLGQAKNYGIWVAIRPEHALLSLADIHHFCSVGDFVIFAAIVCATARFLRRYLRPATPTPIGGAQ